MSDEKPKVYHLIDKGDIEALGGCGCSFAVAAFVIFIIATLIKGAFLVWAR